MLRVYLSGQEAVNSGLQGNEKGCCGKPQKVGGVKKWENYLTYRHHLT